MNTLFCEMVVVHGTLITIRKNALGSFGSLCFSNSFLSFFWSNSISFLFLFTFLLTWYDIVICMILLLGMTRLLNHK